MRIHVYTVCWNEAAMLPHFLRHYRFADRIVVYDHHSTDDSAAIIRRFPNTILRTLRALNEIHESHLLWVKNHIYRECRGDADFVIAVDVDEFVYHPLLIDLLERYMAEGITLPKVKGYNMVSDRLPSPGEDILRAVRHGVPDDVTVEGYCNAYGKRCIFHPSIDINYQHGCHGCRPKGTVRESKTAQIKLLHYKFLGLEYTLRRHGEYRQRLSEDMVKKDMWVQYTWSEDRVAELFNTLRKKVVQVL
jgi:glycosyltransferase involved in cell wall biosynthesis